MYGYNTLRDCIKHEVFSKKHSSFRDDLEREIILEWWLEKGFTRDDYEVAAKRGFDPRTLCGSNF